MGRNRRVSFIVGLIMFPTLLFAQFNNNTVSPYSRFGMGELSPNSFGRSIGMGGASLASRYSQQINSSNPASYTSIDSMSFLFEFGIDARFSNFENDLGSVKANATNFQYFAMSFRINDKFASSLGLKPYSDIGYNVETIEEIDQMYVGNVHTKYYGTGTISNAYIGLGYRPFENISIGVNLNYRFGKMNRNAEVTFLNFSDFYGVQQYSDFRLRDFGLDFGVQVTVPLKEGQHLVFAGVLENKPDYTTVFSDITQKNLKIGNGTDQDTLRYQSNDKESILMPLGFGGGVSYVKDNSIEINLDYVHQGWSNARFNDSKNRFLTNSDKFALGAEWIPNKFSIRNYLSTVAYRVGVRYEESYLLINEQQINDFGISFGVGLPITRSKTTINIAAELGRRGTKSHGLVLENYAILNLSANLHEFWFQKRKIN